jgi:hypothetical protein
MSATASLRAPPPPRAPDAGMARLRKRLRSWMLTFVSMTAGVKLGYLAGAKISAKAI